jgi:MscS family membrane protein
MQPKQLHSITQQQRSYGAASVLCVDLRYLSVARVIYAFLCVLLFAALPSQAPAQSLYQKYIKQQQKEILKAPSEKPEMPSDENGMPETLRMPAMPLMEFRAKDIIGMFPLAPADTSSPRATLDSFLDIMEETNHLIQEAYEENTGMGAFSMETLGMSKNHEHIQNKIHLAEILLERARGCFDLSGLPSATRQQTSLELVLQLKEILDRIPLPPFPDIPGTTAGTYDFNQADLENSWTIPFTQIVITKMTEGPQEGEYVFSAQTVDRIPEFYEEVKALPSRSPIPQDLYHFFASSPGHLLPPAWFSLIESQPPWLLELYYGQAVWQWFALILITAIAAVILFFFITTMRRLPDRKKPVRRQVLSIITSGVIVGSLIFLRYLADYQINIGGPVLQVYDLTIETLVWIGSAVIIYKVLRLLSELVLLKNRGVASIDRSIIRTATQFFAILCALILLTYGATRLNIPLYGIIAGISVGGLAIALAAQPTLENLLGGLILYADGIVRVGDYCEFNKVRGHVESIGMRSTRIRTTDRTLVTIPNADLAKMNFMNYTLKDHFRVVLRFALKYDTSAEQLEKLITKIKRMLAKHPLSQPDAAKVRLENIDENGIVIQIEDSVQAATRDEYLAIQESIIIRTLKLISDQNIEVAHPFVTNYGENNALQPPETPAVPVVKPKQEPIPQAGSKPKTKTPKEKKRKA